MISLVPYHSVRVLVLVVWNVITVEVGAGGTGDECSSPTALWFSLEPYWLPSKSLGAATVNVVNITMSCLFF